MVVYRLHCKVTGLDYIGLTRRSLKQRLARHRHSAFQSKGMDRMFLIAQAIREHGWDQFEVSTVATHDSVQEMVDAEKQAIVQYGTLMPSGYNQRFGVCDDYMFKSTLGRPSPTRGRKLSAEVRARMSASSMGMSTRAIRYQRVRYKSVKECAEANGLSRGQIYHLIRCGKVKYLEPQITRPQAGARIGRVVSDATRLRMREGQRTSPHSRLKPVEFNGVRYAAVVDAASANGLTVPQMKYRIRTGRARFIPKEQMT